MIFDVSHGDRDGTVGQGSLRNLFLRWRQITAFIVDWMEHNHMPLPASSLNILTLMEEKALRDREKIEVNITHVALLSAIP